MLVACLAVLKFQGPRHRLLLLWCEPFGVHGFFRQVLQHEQPRNDRGNTFNNEQPLPVGQVAHTLHSVQNQAGQRSADDASERERGHEQPVDARPVFGRKPIGEIKHHAREEPGFKYAQQKAHDVELRGGGDIRHTDGSGAP